MTEERYLTGYCRQLDAGRMVEVLVEDGRVTEVDCCYGVCAFEGSCTVAKAIEEWKAKSGCEG